MKNSVSLQFVPHAEIAYLSSFKRVKFLVELAIQNKILLVQGALDSTEQADLIEETMRRIKGSSRFKGIEIATFVPQTKGISMLDALREGVARALIGNRDQFTIIGPASVVREIKKDPTKIELLLRK